GRRPEHAHRSAVPTGPLGSQLDTLVVAPVFGACPCVGRAQLGQDCQDLRLVHQACHRIRCPSPQSLHSSSHRPRRSKSSVSPDIGKKKQRVSSGECEQFSTPSNVATARCGCSYSVTTHLNCGQSVSNVAV